MILFLIAILWIVSFALRITSSGINTIRKVNDRIINLSEDIDNKIAEKMGKDEKSSKDVLKFANNTVGNLSVKSIKLVRSILDLIRYVLSLILPLVLVFDVIVYVLLLSATSGYVLLATTNNESSSKNNSVVIKNTNTSVDNVNSKSKILLIGDSRTVQLGSLVLNMSYKEDSDGLAYIIDSTSEGDYLYCKGSMGISWMKEQESNIDSKVDSNTSVVVSMGVNDCSTSAMLNEYVNYLNNKYLDWSSKGASVYFVSINPVNDEKAKNNGYSIINNSITTFNSSIQGKLNPKIGYIDTYSVVESLIIDDGDTPDGVHYNTAVYQKIKDTIWGIAKSKSNNQSSSNALIGEKIIAEAEKYVGVLDYVYGGVSLETGVDCSGFICAIYEKFGYNLWGNRIELRKVGVQVPSIDEAQAGDILVYSGHVALYDGKGGRIHAPQTGEKVRHDNYVGDYYMIRRVV